MRVVFNNGQVGLLCHLVARIDAGKLLRERLAERECFSAFSYHYIRHGSPKGIARGLIGSNSRDCPAWLFEVIPQYSHL